MSESPQDTTSAGVPPSAGLITSAGVWDALVREPTTGVAIVSIDGQNLWMNDQEARIIHGATAKAADFIGKSWADLHDPRWVEERMKILQDMGESKRPVMLRTIWRGRQQVSWIHPIEAELEDSMSEDDGPAGNLPERFLVITRRIGGDWESEAVSNGPVDVVESEVMELGGLDVLSPRELEVLALVGQGMSLKEIAATLHRSYKTIENHRGSIGKKLHLDDRVKLAEIAHRAGLTLADVDRTRVEPSSP